jgi:HAMP domain-containing protein
VLECREERIGSLGLAVIWLYVFGAGLATSGLLFIGLGHLSRGREERGRGTMNHPRPRQTRRGMI